MKQKQKNKAFPKRLGGKEICEGVDESVRKNKEVGVKDVKRQTIYLRNLRYSI